MSRRSKNSFGSWVVTLCAIFVFIFSLSVISFVYNDFAKEELYANNDVLEEDFGELSKRSENNIPQINVSPDEEDSKSAEITTTMRNGSRYKLPFPSSEFIGSEGLLPGTNIIVLKEKTNSTVRFDSCTVAFSLPGKEGLPWAITAGHCGYEGAKVYTKPQGNDFSTSRFLGTLRKVSLSNYDNGTDDWGAIRLYPEAVRPSSPEDVPLYLSTFEQEESKKLCKDGSTTERTCGVQGRKNIKAILTGEESGTISGKLDEATMCSLPGDSGSPVFDEDSIIGMVVSTSSSDSDIEQGLCSSKASSYYIPVENILKQISTSISDVIVPVD